ncbi:MAG: hypothetical protein AAF705_07700, partial [Bacteroidota bacterium]
DREVVRAGRLTILFALLTGVTMGLVLLYLKFENPEAAFTHRLNEIRYFINCGIVVIICTAAFLLAPKPGLAIAAFALTIPANILMIKFLPEMNYFVRAMWVILFGLAITFLPSILGKGFYKGKDLFVFSSPQAKWFGWALLVLMGLIHVIFS